LDLDNLFEINDKVKIIKDLSMMTMGNDPCHGWPHVKRVAAYALKIIDDESVDYEVLAIAILLHDIGRFYKTDLHHAISSSKVAGILLRGLGYSDEFIDKVELDNSKLTLKIGMQYKIPEPNITIGLNLDYTKAVDYLKTEQDDPVFKAKLAFKFGF